MGIIVNWDRSVNSLLDEITDYVNVELSDNEFVELYRTVESDLGQYDNIGISDIEGSINAFLRSIGYVYNDNCIWEKPLYKKQNEMVNDKIISTHMCFVANKLDIAKKQILKFVSSFDLDISGANGKEYTFPEALERGYVSTIHYLLNESDATDVQNLIHDVLSTVVQTYDDGAAYDLIFDSVNDQFAVAFTYC